MAVASWQFLAGLSKAFRRMYLPWWGSLEEEAGLQVPLFEAVLRKHVAMPGASGPKELPLQAFQLCLLFRGRGTHRTFRPGIGFASKLLTVSPARPSLATSKAW